MKYLREQMVACAVPSPDRAKKERRVEVVNARDDEDAGRIRWLFADTAYQVMYEDALGCKHKTSKGLKVSRRDAMGNMLEPAVFKAARLLTLTKARAFCNKHDETSAARYEVPNDAEV